MVCFFIADLMFQIVSRETLVIIFIQFVSRETLHKKRGIYFTSFFSICLVCRICVANRLRYSN